MSISENLFILASIIFIFMFIGYNVGFKQATNNTTENWKQLTVEKGLAMYCPSNGHWAWNGECDD